jgi:hypothetical protein
MYFDLERLPVEDFRDQDGNTLSSSTFMFIGGLLKKVGIKTVRGIIVARRQRARRRQKQALLTEKEVPRRARPDSRDYLESLSILVSLAITLRVLSDMYGLSVWPCFARIYQTSTITSIIDYDTIHHILFQTRDVRQFSRLYPQKEPNECRLPTFGSINTHHRIFDRFFVLLETILNGIMQYLTGDYTTKWHLRSYPLPAAIELDYKLIVKHIGTQDFRKYYHPIKSAAPLYRLCFEREGVYSGGRAVEKIGIIERVIRDMLTDNSYKIKCLCRDAHFIINDFFSKQANNLYIICEFSHASICSRRCSRATGQTLFMQTDIFNKKISAKCQKPPVPQVRYRSSKVKHVYDHHKA